MESGPSQRKKIPDRVKRGRDFLTDLLDVLHTWGGDLKKTLYNRANGDVEETSLNFYNYTGVDMLNEPIGYHEMQSKD